MKLTTTQLRRIIKEETQKLLNEDTAENNEASQLQKTALDAASQIVDGIETLQETMNKLRNVKGLSQQAQTFVWRVIDYIDSDHKLSSWNSMKQSIEDLERYVKKGYVDPPEPEHIKRLRGL